MSHDKIQKLNYLAFQLVVQHHLNACDISILARDKVQFVWIWRQNHDLYHILNIAKTGIIQYIQSGGIL